ncbi:hypothetical protein FOCC_FOCC002365 [Frankliniella occidentalis]|uniref:Uncharacterized protein LOC127748809 n=1 Tax=Frankliniella occidentalis TaxID=133901 RepID=A0A9C6TYV8_FRAOC|nr:uncharacterized protein LOC127748809 [Frankliniella occidentalis]KAE8750937.1 hypothetical protein FOCC_FOCC002365 [Frankliniella occidentalis]
MKIAIQQVRSGIKVRTAAQNNNVNHMTLRRYIAKTENVEDLDTVRLSPDYATKLIFPKELEDSLAGYVIECSQMGYGLSSVDIRKFAVQLGVANNLTNLPKSWLENEMAGADWFLGFMKRPPLLSLRKPEQCSVARAMAFNKTNINNYFDKLEAVLKRHPSFGNGTRIFNLDETGSTTVGEIKKNKVIAEKGVKQLHQIKSAERGTLVTTCCCICANGTMLPPAMVFPRVKFTQNMLINCYPGTLGLASKKGWMTSELFVKVIQHFIAHAQSSKEHPTLLILDNVASHLSIDVINLCRDNGVTLFTLPPHTTHKTQPLDVAIYGPYQAAYSRAYNDWTIAHPGQVCTIYDVAGLVNKAICKSGTPSNIFSAFRATGIYPFNRNIFSDVDFAPSIVTENQPPPIHQPEAESQDGHGTQEKTQEEEEHEADNPEPNISQTPRRIITPRKVRPLPKAKPRETTSKKPRAKGKCRVATDTPEKNEIEEKTRAKKAKEAEQEAKRKARAGKNLDKLLVPGHSNNNKRKAPTKNKKAKRSKVTQESESSDPDSDIELVEESEEEMWEGDENYSSGDLNEDENLFGPLEKDPEEGDHILVVFRGKEDKYYVGKVLSAKDAEGDLEVSYYRQSGKTLYKFSLPNIPDLKSVHIDDVIAVLPKPIMGGTRRQRDLISFDFNFSGIRLG